MYYHNYVELSVQLQTDGQTDDWTHGWTDGPTGGRADVQKGGMDRRIDRWTERRMGGRTKTEVCRVASPRLQISDIPLF